MIYLLWSKLPRYAKNINIGEYSENSQILMNKF